MEYYKISGCYLKVVEGMLEPVFKGPRIGIYKSKEGGDNLITLVHGESGRCGIFGSDRNLLAKIISAHLEFSEANLEIEQVDSY